MKPDIGSESRFLPTPPAWGGVKGGLCVVDGGWQGVGIGTRDCDGTVADCNARSSDGGDLLHLRLQQQANRIKERK